MRAGRCELLGDGVEIVAPIEDSVVAWSSRAATSAAAAWLIHRPGDGTQNESKRRQLRYRSKLILRSRNAECTIRIPGPAT